MQLVLPRLSTLIPERLPRLSPRMAKIYSIIAAALILVAPIPIAGGIWYRLATAPTHDETSNSALVVGSRYGIALRDNDLTQIRYPIGDAARRAGIRRDDQILAVNGLRTSPLSMEDWRRNPNRAGPLAPLVEGSGRRPLVLLVRSRQGTLRSFRTAPSETHIEGEANRLAVPGWSLTVIDLAHVITYPFLLWIAFALRRGSTREIVPGLFCLSVLLTIMSEQPAATFLDYVLHVPVLWHRTMYDIGNICLLAGLLLFPHGALRPLGIVGILCLLPVLLFLSGDAYRVVFVIFIVFGLSLTGRRLATSSPERRQQIKLMLIVVGGYTAFLFAALFFDMRKLGTRSLGGQLAFEVMAGLTFGFAYLSLIAGIFAAFKRYRMYDAEAVLSRSASVALVTLMLTIVFAALEGGIQAGLGNSAGVAPSVIAGAVVALLIKPVHAHVRDWAERKFQKNLVELRNGLPDCVNDLREIASFDEIARSVVDRVSRGIRATHVALVVSGSVKATCDIAASAAQDWVDQHGGLQGAVSTSEAVFPLMVPLTVHHQADATSGWLLVGPRPDGSSYSKEERSVLFEVADPVARALQIANSRERKEEADQRWRSKMDHRTSYLEQQIAELAALRSS